MKNEQHTPNELRHLAIIMDGNGRWASARGKKRTEGHAEGCRVVREITTWCAKSGVAFLSLYAFSTENWRRPKIEVDFLMKLLEKYLKSEAQTYAKNNIRFRAIGDYSEFSEPLKTLIAKLEADTAQNSALTQILALNYGAKDEIARAAIRANIAPDSTKEAACAALEENLDTAGLPSVDLLVRTGGEMRLSNFLLWQCAYAELHFTKTLFPDFSSAELGEIIEDYKRRHRRFGGL